MLKFFRKKAKTNEKQQESSCQESSTQPEVVSDGAQEPATTVSPSITLETQEVSQQSLEDTPSETITDATESLEPNKPETKRSFFQKLKTSLRKTRHSLTSGLANLFLGKKTIDEDLLEELETLLLIADVGVEATQKIIDSLTQQISRKTLKDPQAVYLALKQMLLDMLKPCEQPLNIPESQKPFVVLMVGVNGAGKTTTIGKLANQFKRQGKSIQLAAGDTFRAAAIEQLKVWGERNQIPVIAQHTGADSASVIYDALQSTLAKDIDVLIADTAGRLHTRDNLMEELKKITRVMKKIQPEAPHEIMLVLDATMGQNALQQARVFHSMINLSSIAITKLDGTAKGGILFAIANELKLPIRYIGIGEGVDDLKPFEAQTFVEALFDEL